MTEPKTQFELVDYLVLEANSHCNLACASCNRAQLEAAGLRQAKVMSEEELRFIMNVFSNHRLHTIKFEWLSEPMLHSQYDVLCDLIKAKQPQAFLITATNLQYSLDKVPFRQMLPFVDMVYLSIDGVESRYERARQGAKWERLLESLDQIVSSVDASTRKQKLHINMTVTKDNYRDIAKIYDLRQRFGFASVRLNLAQEWSVDSCPFPKVTSRMVDELRKWRADLKGVAGWDYKDCFWPFNGLTIDVYGNIRQCIIKTNSQPIGNVFTDNVREIFNSSPMLVKARDRIRANAPPAGCETCSYKFLSPILRAIFANHDSPKPKPRIDLGVS